VYALCGDCSPIVSAWQLACPGVSGKGCLAALSELRAVGIEEVICHMNCAGGLEHRQLLPSMQLFAAEVMPQLA
jgi:hypothetical protein